LRPQLTRQQQVLLRSVLPFVERYGRYMARDWRRIRDDEFVSIGNEALETAVRKFDPMKGNFEAFSRAVVARAMLSYARRQNRKPDPLIEALQLARSLPLDLTRWTLRAASTSRAE
jgi:DNA-directed RNA polymerase specialized sigma subunit